MQKLHESPSQLTLPACARIPGPGPRRGALSGGMVVLLGFLAVVLLVGLVVVGQFNGFVSNQENVEQKWAEVENQYKRRYDLIPQLVETVKGAASFEQETLTELTEARAQVGRVSLPENLPTDQAKLDAYVRAQQGLGSTLGRLFAVAENYPQLKATEAFRDLQTQLEGTENRIGVARSDYTVAVKNYNTGVRRFPGNLLAGLFGFDELPQFTVTAEEQAVPQVDFSDDE